MAKKKAASTKSKSFSRASLVAMPSAGSAAANLNFTFTSGLGQATCSLFRRGVLINMQSISHSGAIHFSDVQPGDAVSVNGVCTGTAKLDINLPTTPATPQSFSAGVILAAFLFN